MDLTDFDGKHDFAKYSSFRIEGETEKYKLILGNFLGGGAGEQLGVGGRAVRRGLLSYSGRRRARFPSPPGGLELFHHRQNTDISPRVLKPCFYKERTYLGP